MTCPAERQVTRRSSMLPHREPRGWETPRDGSSNLVVSDAEAGARWVAILTGTHTTDRIRS